MKKELALVFQKLRNQVSEVVPLHECDHSTSDWTSELFSGMVGSDQEGDHEVEVEEVLRWFGEKKLEQYRRSSSRRLKARDDPVASPSKHPFYRDESTSRMHRNA